MKTKTLWKPSFINFRNEKDNKEIGNKLENDIAKSEGYSGKSKKAHQQH